MTMKPISLTTEETKGQRNQVTCPQSQSKSMFKTKVAVQACPAPKSMLSADHSERRARDLMLSRLGSWAPPLEGWTSDSSQQPSPAVLTTLRPILSQA